MNYVLQREAQAAVIQQYHLKNTISDDLIILGDFNDFDEQVLDSAGALDKPLSTTLSILRKSRQPELFNVAHLFSERSDRYSVWFDRNKNCLDDFGVEHVLIDHILVSDGNPHLSLISLII